MNFCEKSTIIIENLKKLIFQDSPVFFKRWKSVVFMRRTKKEFLQELKMKKIKFLLLILLIMLSACTKKEPVVVEDEEEESVEVEEEKITDIPCVMLGDFYYEENLDGGFSRSLAAVEGSAVFAPISDKESDKGLPESKVDEAKNIFVRVNLEDDLSERILWADINELAINAHPGCTYETGSDIFIFDKPDFNSQGRTKLLPDMLLAIYADFPNPDGFPDADKFQKIKIRLGNASTLIEGFLKSIQLDQSPERVSLIQVTKKYSELLESGNASNETLAELSDTIEELRQWSDIRW